MPNNDKSKNVKKDKVAPAKQHTRTGERGKKKDKTDSFKQHAR